MNSTDYIKADTIVEAINLLNCSEITSKPIAGGTDLLVQRRVEDPNYDRLVDVSRVLKLKEIKVEENSILIGAGATFTEIINHHLIKENINVLVEACSSIGSPQIRNMGTIGGNVANAAACADSLSALVCLDAKVNLISIEGNRQILLSKFVQGPHKTVIKQNELITHFVLDFLPRNVKSHFIKIGRRNAQSISRLNIAGVGGINSQGVIDFIKICPGASTPKTERFNSVEDYLIGKKPEEKYFIEAGALAAKTMIEITGIRWSTQYKEKAISALTDRVLRKIFL